jgi:hypothetical protein
LGAVGPRLLNWLSLDRHHLQNSLSTIVGYAAIAAAFRAADVIDVTLGDGTTTRIRAVPVPGGRKRQLLLDLMARIVDAEDVSVDTIVVSNWARTGWNVISPNVLIDATATRDVTAWQQLRGRAMRPASSWSADSQRLLQRLLATPTDAVLEIDENPSPGCYETPEDRAVSVMLARNKVTHVYELVRAYGSRPQVERKRRSAGWERVEAIAEKHRREGGVRPSDGAYVTGTGHAPLLIAEDPRHDSPAELREVLQDALLGADARVVRGWLRAAARSPADKEPRGGDSIAAPSR